jgi:heme oxygenase
MQTVDNLYGLKVGDKVQYIGNNEQFYNKSLFNKIGDIVKILPSTGEFVVKINELHYDVSFSRNDLYLIDSYERLDVDFEGILTQANLMTVNEMCGYLTKYHDLVEGKDFSLSVRDDLNEVFLTNDKYATLIKDLIDVQKVNRELANSYTDDFKQKMKTVVQHTGAVSLMFKISNWTFRTHLTPWTIQHSLLLNYDVNLYEEWGFKNI